MRILIDLQGAQNESRHRGIGRYCLALTKAIIRNRNDHEIFVMLNQLFPETISEIKKTFVSLIPASHIVIFEAEGPVDELSPANSWRVKAAEVLREKFINDLSPDVVLIGSLFEGSCDNTITSIGVLNSKIPVAVILYDLIPYLNPKKYIGDEVTASWYYRKIASLKRANLLLAISNSARNEVLENLNLNEETIVNISSAVDDSFKLNKIRPIDLEKIFKKFNILKKYVMHSSAFEERKNFEGLIKAFAALPTSLRKDYQLVLVCKIDEGAKLNLRKMAAKLGLAETDMVLTGYVPDDELIALYSACHLFVFPSFHEGFGLPALEAMSCGAPTIGSNRTSIPEVIGRDDALFDPASTSSMMASIKKALTDTNYRESLKAHAVTQAKKFNWDNCARTAIQALESVHQPESGDSSKQERAELARDFFEGLVRLKSSVSPTEADILETSRAAAKNESEASLVNGNADFSGKIRWRVEGPFDSSYSLALLNRETARALDELGHLVVLHSTEGPGDFLPNEKFLHENSDLAEMHARVASNPPATVNISSRNLYPPRVADMCSPVNMLHHYAWEESGFPSQWIDDFNKNLTGITCLSNHVEKILIDNGVRIPISTSGCGVDHWERIESSSSFKLKAKKFKFLHVSSCFPRKGADSLLEAYGNSFSSDDDVTLVIKTFPNPHNEIHKWYQDRKKSFLKFPDVLIIEENFSDSDLKSLYHKCQVLVAPSRAEGFGLPMAEAMLTGLPVITTAWGGQLDFCNELNSWLVDFEFKKAETHFNLFGSAWADISIEGLSKALKAAYNTSPKKLAHMANLGRVNLLENFRWKDVTARAVNSALDWGKSTNEKRKPKIGWMTTWNKKCGIATYSEHLIRHINDDSLMVLAPEQESSTVADSNNCIRCWREGKNNNNLSATWDVIERSGLDLIVIQFNYGFFNFVDFGLFIETILNNGLSLIVMLHSTNDPFGELENWQLKEIKKAFSRCDRLLVHSVKDLNTLKKIGLIDNVTLFPHGVLSQAVTPKTKNKRIYPLIASYGFCLPHKGLRELIQAAALLRDRQQPVMLRLVNAEYPDPISSKLILELKALVTELNMESFVEFFTNFLQDSQSLELLSEADLLVFAYQNTGESSSAAVRYGLSVERPVAVTPLGIFDDIEGAAFRFSDTSPEIIASGLVEYLNDIAKNSDSARKIELEAVRWRAFYAHSNVAKRLSNIFIAVDRKKPPASRSFLASCSRMGSVVGLVRGGTVFSSGVKGNLLHGPYIALSPGQYEVIVYGGFQKDCSQSAQVDVAINGGGEILSVIGFSESNIGNIALLHISLTKPCFDLEVRVWVDARSIVNISRVVIRSAVRGAIDMEITA